MDQTIRIRSARPDAASALAGLFTELGFPASSSEMAKQLEGFLPSESVLVADRNGSVLGVVTAHVTPVLHRATPVGGLTALVVTERARGQGIGRMLVENAERLLGERGCQLIELTSNQQLADAHQFYRRLGYELTS